MYELGKLSLNAWQLFPLFLFLFQHTAIQYKIHAYTHLNTQIYLPQGWECQDTLPGPDEAAGYGYGRTRTVSPNTPFVCPCFLASGWWDYEDTGTVVRCWVAVKLGELGLSYRAKMGLCQAWAQLHPLHHASPIVMVWFTHRMVFSTGSFHCPSHTHTHTYTHAHTFYIAIPVHTFIDLLHAATLKLNLPNACLSITTVYTHEYNAVLTLIYIMLS